MLEQRAGRATARERSPKPVLTSTNDALRADWENEEKAKQTCNKWGIKDPPGGGLKVASTAGKSRSCLFSQ
jgi:hypothetical protein